MTIEANLRQGDLGVGVDSLSKIQTSVTPPEIWLREDLKKVYAALLVRSGTARSWRSAALAG